MKRIVLFCAAGMSTSLLVNKMREAAQAGGYDYEINAYPLSQIPIIGPLADVILLGPQVRYHLSNTKQQCPGVPIEVIDMIAYGMLDGKKVIAQVSQMIVK